MNQHELDQLLRKVPVPERTEQYWEEFPETITRRIKNEDIIGSALVYDSLKKSCCGVPEDCAHHPKRTKNIAVANLNGPATAQCRQVFRAD